MLKSPEDAFNLLERLSAPRRLLKHLELVGEVGGEVISKLDDLGVQYDKRFVQVGIAVHDAAGEKLLLEHGVDAKIARCCRSHAQYASMGASFEELIIALADTLWKGSREADLELQVIDGVAARLQTDRWELFQTLDSYFEDIAADGDERLSRSI